MAIVIMAIVRVSLTKYSSSGLEGLLLLLAPMLVWPRDINPRCRLPHQLFNPHLNGVR
jgi:hypothetical protein